MHALHKTLLHGKQLQQIDMDWLGNLPSSSISVDDKDQAWLWKQSFVDGFVHIRLPWLLAATADAYANGSLLQRVEALAWLERVLADETVIKSDTRPENWWRAELLYGFRYVLQRAEPHGGASGGGT